MLRCAQGAIYELTSPDGKDCGKLLKTLKFKAALPITGNDIGARPFKYSIPCWQKPSTA